MPRAKQGGSRTGTPGGQYPNRSDLRSPGNETVRGQPYGQAAAQQAAQRAVPITPPPTATQAPAANTAVPGGGMQGGTGPATAPVATPGPGEVNLFAPTARPNEPVTSGVNVGPGPGSEALNQIPIGMVANNMADHDTTAALIANLASRPGSGAVLKSLASAVVNGPVR